MKQFLIIISFVFFAFTTQSQTVKVYLSDSISGRDGKLFYIHQVTQGQTAYSIAKAYNVSVDELYFENPGTESGLGMDQYLWIPTVNKETELNKEVKSADYEFFYHIIKRGENFSGLAVKYNIPVPYIKQANADLSEPLREGQYVRIPVDGAFSTLIPDQANDGFNSDINIIPDFRHEVIKGETLYSISRKYKVTVDELKMVNPGLAQTIEIGDLLRIPKPTQDGKRLAENEKSTQKKESQQEPDFYSHKVKSKETLYSISRIYGVTLQDLYDANSGLTTNIDVGQVLRVPNKLIDKPYIIYNASRKTKLNKVAKLYNVPVSMLQRENPSIKNRVLPGQKVRVPVGAKARIASEEKVAEPKPEKIEDEIVVEAKPVRKGCAKLEPNYDKIFNVALMIPFYLEELDSLDVEQFITGHQDNFTPFRFLRFYEGALIAVDSLKSLGFNINLFVYDVDASITKTAKVLQNPELRKMDLIIGPFQSKSFDQVALFAGNFNIPIINPFSFREEVTQKYRSAIKVKSNTKFQADLLPSIIQSEHKYSKVYLITHSSYQDVNEVAQIRQKVASSIVPTHSIPNTDLYNLAVGVAFRDEEYEEGQALPNYTYEGVKIMVDSLTTLAEDSTTFQNRLVTINYMKDSLYPFFESASALRENLAIIYGDNESFFGDAMNRLNEFRDTFNIQVIAMPTPERFRYLDEVQANNMNLTYFSTSYINYMDISIQAFINKFRKRYNTDPDIYGFNGFDVTYYFIDALVTLDDRMRSCFDQYPAEMLLNKYAIKRVEGTGNYENSYWNIIRYERLSRVKQPDPPIDVNQVSE